MSNAKLKFADEIARFVQMFGGLVAYGEEVGNIGSLEQARAQAEELSAKARDELTALQAEIKSHRSTYKAECDLVRSRAEQYADEVKAKADSASKIAEQMAAQTITNANAEAATIVEVAHKEKGGLADQIAKAQQMLDQVNADVVSAREELDRTGGQLHLKQTELTDVAAKHGEFLKSIGAK